MENLIANFPKSHVHFVIPRIILEKIDFEKKPPKR